MNAIEVRNLNKEYKNFKLDEVSFDVQEGHIAGFIGRNGAGKTTSIKSILNIVKINSGVIKFFDLPLNENENLIKSQIGYSSGSVNYYQKKKLSKIIEVTKTFYPTWDDKLMNEYKELFNLDFSKTPSELSEGMKVKFNMLLSLSHHAKVLILDEPTSGLDPFSRDEILEIFLKLKEKGTSILFSTHIISDIEKCADDIIYIRSGRIVSSSSKADFIKTYSKENESLEETMLRLERGQHD